MKLPYGYVLIGKEIVIHEQSQMALHPAWRLAHADVAHIVCHVAGAQVRSLHLHADRLVGVADGVV